MTQSPEVRDGARDCCFWSGTAIAYAESLDLLKMVRATKDAEEKGFLHRLWCCCFVSDTIFAFSRRRAPKIRVDLEIGPLLESQELNDQGLPFARTKSSPCNYTGATAHLMEPFGRLVRLMSLINDMLSIKHAAPCPSSHHDNITHESETRSSIALMSPELAACRDQLQTRVDVLSQQLGRSDERSSSNSGQCASSERLFLLIIMAAADCVFYFDPKCTLRCQHTESDRVSCRRFRKRACDAARQTSQLAKDALGSQCPLFMPAWR